MSTKSNGVEKKQKRILYVMVGVLAFAAIGIFYALFDTSPEKVFKRSADLPLDKVNPQEIWMTRIEGENKMITSQLKYIETMFLENKKKEDENSNLQSEVQKLKNDLRSMAEKKYTDVASEPYRPTQKNDDPLFESSGYEEIRGRPVLVEIVCDSRKEKVFHVNRVIPAGTSVKALLVSSIDAPCSVLSHSDPQPVKLQVLDDGHLPKGVMAKLKGAILIASVYGDLSSERVFMRLERLTQVKANGEFIETTVTGYVTGEDGKYGVRGIVVDKSTKMVGNAALSGIFSGISDYMQAKAGAEWIVPYENGGASQRYGSDIAIQGGVSGAHSAFDVLTDYYIKRAEQIRPVIEVTAGRVVDITFTHSAELGDLYTQDKVQKIREENR